MGRADHGPVMDQKCKVQIDEETLHPDLSTEYILGQEALNACCLLCQTSHKTVKLFYGPFGQSSKHRNQISAQTSQEGIK